MTLYRRSLEVLKTDGVREFCRKGFAKVSENIAMRRALQQGELNQQIGTKEIRFHVDTNADYLLSLLNDSEVAILEDMVSELEAGETFFDIGSAVGAYAIAVAKHRPDVDVVAFEPNPMNLDLLRENVALNDVAVDVRSVALADTDGTVAFETPSVSGSGQLGGDDPDSTRSVRTLRGDAFVSETGYLPNVVKMDVEGAEPLVADGLRETLGNPEARLLYCEIHRPHSGNKITNFGTTPAEFEDSLRELGFGIEVLREPHPEWNYFIKASK